MAAARSLTVPRANHPDDECRPAEALGLTSRTVRRDWVKAKGWLHQALP